MQLVTKYLNDDYDPSCRQDVTRIGGGTDFKFSIRRGILILLATELTVDAIG